MDEDTADNQNNDGAMKPRDGESLVEPLPQDNAPPFSPPGDPVDDAAAQADQRTQSGQIDDTHQATDTNVDSHQTYDEGLAGAAEAQEPNAGNAVVGYDPEHDQRTDSEAK